MYNLDLVIKIYLIYSELLKSSTLSSKRLKVFQIKTCVDTGTRIIISSKIYTHPVKTTLCFSKPFRCFLFIVQW